MRPEPPTRADVPVLRHIGVLAACRAAGGQNDIHLEREAALVWEGEKILWAGADCNLPREFAALDELRDAERRLLIPGLIDCHTHLAFAGWRADEFAQRALGRTYAEIAASGGGILKTVKTTRAAGDDEIMARCATCLASMAALGVTTVEAKSGYALTADGELRILEIYKALSRAQPIHIVPTLLAAHTLPPEYENDRSGYVRLVTAQMIPETVRRGLARFCDAFADESAFTIEEAEQVLRAGLVHGLAPKLHADQFAADGGAALAASLGAVSADHLECVSEAGIRHLAASGTVAVSLPISSMYLGHAPAPARRLIETGVPVAVATDFNPGTAPSYHLPLALLLACTAQRMTPAEALKGATIFAARACGEEAEAGSIEPGKRADFTIIDASTVDEWLYHFTANACVATYISGKKVYG